MRRKMVGTSTMMLICRARTSRAIPAAPSTSAWKIWREAPFSSAPKIRRTEEMTPE